MSSLILRGASYHDPQKYFKYWAKYNFSTIDTCLRRLFLIISYNFTRFHKYLLSCNRACKIFFHSNGFARFTFATNNYCILCMSLNFGHSNNQNRPCHIQWPAGVSIFDFNILSIYQHWFSLAYFMYWHYNASWKVWRILKTVAENGKERRLCSFWALFLFFID